MTELTNDQSVCAGRSRASTVSLRSTTTGEVPSLTTTCSCEPDGSFSSQRRSGST
jgi:hypothetical protein